MAIQIMNFPVEVHEKILKYLTGYSLINAANTCRLWRTLCFRQLQAARISKIPKECCIEVDEYSDLITEDAVMKAYNLYLLQQKLINNMLKNEVFQVTQVTFENLKTFSIKDTLLFIATKTGKISVYDLKNKNKRIKKLVFELDLEINDILEIRVIKKLNLLFVLRPKELCFFDIEVVNSVVSLKKLFVKFANLEELLPDMDFEFYHSSSVFGDGLALTVNSDIVALFKVHRKDSAVFLYHVKHLQTEVKILQCSLYDYTIVVLLDNGDMMRWDVVMNEIETNEKLTEVCYQNPCWIFRGRLFCSTIISSQLLGYWHMDRGASYWVIGLPGQDVFRCRDLGTTFSADTSVEDVLCVYMRQRLLACGTKEGKVLIYYLSDDFFLPDATGFTEFDRVPDLTIRVTNRPIREVLIEFLDKSIIIVVWPYVNSEGPGSSGVVQFIHLSDGDWVTKEEIDSLS